MNDEKDERVEALMHAVRAYGKSSNADGWDDGMRKVPQRGSLSVATVRALNEVENAARRLSGWPNADVWAAHQRVILVLSEGLGIDHPVVTDWAVVGFALKAGPLCSFPECAAPPTRPPEPNSLKD